MQVTDRAYQNHQLFTELHRYMKFYEQWAMSVFSFATMGTKSICNIDTYVYSSMYGTIESIKVILLAGRINDAYALLRKYYDSVTINIYSNIYLRNNLSIENFIVKKINDWLQGSEKLPDFRVMSKYIRNAEMLKPINDVFGVDDRYKQIRNRCNDHMHYNFYRYAMLNDNDIYIDNRLWWIDRFLDDVRDIFVLHVGYISFLNSHYLISSDYLDALECGLQPNDDSQYWVAPFIQEIFDEIITSRRPDVVAVIKKNSLMHLL